MEDYPKTIFEEENVISLRTVYVTDDGNLVSFRLMPAWIQSSIPAKPKGYEWVEQDCAFLYRRVRSREDENQLIESLARWQQCIKPIHFETPPVFSLVWADSGNSVALKLNGEIWVFIDEQTHKGYSKGVLPAPPMTENPWFRMLPRLPATENEWDQSLYEKLFL